ncbi:MAG TPA: CBS domain-containing protein [Pyrinomonadaceae bacterium]|jgi:CBS domain-containing protein|nr:CBS domain-containing protein [Pyrinomonadaceae bacterium]
MSRYRNDRDDDFYREGRRAERGRGDAGEGRYSSSREDYGGRGDYGRTGGGRDNFDYGEPPSAFRGGRGDYQDYGRERPTVRGRGDDDLDDYDRDRRGYGDDDRAGNGRSLFEEGRDYLRDRFGRGGRGRGRERGASRSHVRCRDIMTRDVTVATRQTMLEEVARMMRDEDTGVIPVVELPESLTDIGDTRPDMNRVQPNVVGGGKLVGLITDRDVVVRAIAEGKDVRTTRAEEIMTSDVHTAQPNDRVIDAIRKMGDKQVRRIPIVDRDGVLRGIISMADVALETEDDRELAEALEEISSGSSFWNRIFG